MQSSRPSLRSLATPSPPIPSRRRLPTFRLADRTASSTSSTTTAGVTQQQQCNSPILTTTTTTTTSASNCDTLSQSPTSSCFSEPITFRTKPNFNSGNEISRPIPIRCGHLSCPSSSNNISNSGTYHSSCCSLNSPYQYHGGRAARSWSTGEMLPSSSSSSSNQQLQQQQQYFYNHHHQCNCLPSSSLNYYNHQLPYRRQSQLHLNNDRTSSSSPTPHRVVSFGSAVTPGSITDNDEPLSSLSQPLSMTRPTSLEWSMDDHNNSHSHHSRTKRPIVISKHTSNNNNTSNNPSNISGPHSFLTRRRIKPINSRSNKKISISSRSNSTSSSSIDWGSSSFADRLDEPLSNDNIFQSMSNDKNNKRRNNLLRAQSRNNRSQSALAGDGATNNLHSNHNSRVISSNINDRQKPNSSMTMMRNSNYSSLGMEELSNSTCFSGGMAASSDRLNYYSSSSNLLDRHGTRKGSGRSMYHSSSSSHSSQFHPHHSHHQQYQQSQQLKQQQSQQLQFHSQQQQSHHQSLDRQNECLLGEAIPANHQLESKTRRRFRLLKRKLSVSALRWGNN